MLWSSKEEENEKVGVETDACGVGSGRMGKYLYGEWPHDIYTLTPFGNVFVKVTDTHLGW
jgi:hypothetical protein